MGVVKHPLPRLQPKFMYWVSKQYMIVSNCIAKHSATVNNSSCISLFAKRVQAMTMNKKGARNEFLSKEKQLKSKSRIEGLQRQALTRPYHAGLR